jgi:toxin ParE1/3/4
MARILRTPLARGDLKAIAAYLLSESRSPEIVSRFLDRVTTQSKLYADRPELGELCPDLDPQVRRFTIGNYLAFYRPTRDGIELLRVLHGSRDVANIWQRQ